MRWLYRICIVLVLLLAGGYIYWYFTRPVEEQKFETRPAELKAIREMAQLATLDFHEEMTVKDQIDGKWLVARMTVEGSVKYDLDSIRFDQKGDTVVIILPKEKIDIYESTDKGAYEVLDTWDANRPILGRKLTAAEENAIKERARARLEQTIRNRGYVKRAQDNARVTLTPLLSRLYPDTPYRLCLSSSPE